MIVKIACHNVDSVHNMRMCWSPDIMVASVSLLGMTLLISQPDRCAMCNGKNNMNPDSFIS